MWPLLARSGEPDERNRVARLMHSDGLRGAKRRGKPWRSTQPARHPVARPDLVCREEVARE